MFYCLPPLTGRDLYLGDFALIHQNRMKISEKNINNPKARPAQKRPQNGGRQ